MIGNAVGRGALEYGPANSAFLPIDPCVGISHQFDITTAGDGCLVRCASNVNRALPIAKGSSQFLVSDIGLDVQVEPMARDANAPARRITCLSSRTSPLVAHLNTNIIGRQRLRGTIDIHDRAAAQGIHTTVSPA